MRVDVSPEAEEFVQRQGGQVWVWAAHPKVCCWGNAGLHARGHRSAAGHVGVRPVPSEGLDVWFRIRPADCLMSWRSGCGGSVIPGSRRSGTGALTPSEPGVSTAVPAAPSWRGDPLLDRGPMVRGRAAGAAVMHRRAWLREAAMVCLQGAPLLVVLAPDSDRARRIELRQDYMVVGRTPGCEVRFNDPHVSRAHAALQRRGNAVYVQDLGSSGGTFIDGTAVTRARELRPGDVVTFATVTARFETASADGEDAIAAPSRRMAAAPGRRRPRDRHGKEQGAVAELDRFSGLRRGTHHHRRHRPEPAQGRRAGAPAVRAGHRGPSRRGAGLGPGRGRHPAAGRRDAYRRGRVAQARGLNSRPVSIRRGPIRY